MSANMNVTSRLAKSASGRLSVPLSVMSVFCLVTRFRERNLYSVAPPRADGDCTLMLSMMCGASL